MDLMEIEKLVLLFQTHTVALSCTCETTRLSTSYTKNQVIPYQNSSIQLYTVYV